MTTEKNYARNMSELLLTSSFNRKIYTKYIWKEPSRNQIIIDNRFNSNEKKVKDFTERSKSI